MPDLVIDISDQQSLLLIHAERLREVVGRVLTEELITSAEISLALVDDAAIHQVNRNFLGHDFPTDVISFLLDEHSELTSSVDALGQAATPCGDSTAGTTRVRMRRLEGELVVSTETAIRESVNHGWSAEDELVLYIVHGLLHLCGYDDLTDEARPQMRVRERQLLAHWQLTPTGLEA